MIPPFVCSVCNKMTKYPLVSSFLCMDLAYITCLLKDGFGFKDSTVLQVRKFHTTQSTVTVALLTETQQKECFSKGGEALFKKNKNYLFKVVYRRLQLYES